MKNILSLGVHTMFLVTFLFMLLTITKSLPPHHFTYLGQVTYTEYQGHLNHEEIGEDHEEIGMELYPTGSSLPDCSYACGPCLPCKRVIVSFKCSTAEPCPVVYKCTCKGKYYPVPSN